MTRLAAAIPVITLAFLTGALSVAGCAPATPDLCNDLINCPGVSMTAEQKDMVLGVCPAGLAALQFASPDCYSCVTENTCDAPDTCLQRCGTLINQIMPGTVQ